MTAIHGPCETIVTTSRPVPLTWVWAAAGRGAKGARRATLTPLLAPGSPPAAGSGVPVKPGARLRLHASLRPPRPGEAGTGAPGRGPPPPPPALVSALAAADLLPAIIFIFSRAGCDAFAIDVAAAGVLAPPPAAAAAAIEAELNRLATDSPDALRPDLVPALRCGVAVHHAGCLPGWKGAVERLFQAGHLRAVAATETLAAGINMPARTSVLTALARRRGGATAIPLTHNELLQMAGRAGRRGFDDAGAAVVCESLAGGFDRGPGFASPPALASLLSRGPEKLASQFRPGYSMVLNLVASRPLAGARAFVERSFAAHAAGAGAAARAARLDAAEAAAAAAAEAAAAAAAAARSAGVVAPAGAVADKRAARRALREVVRRVVAARARHAAAALADTHLPARVLLDLTAADPSADEAVPALVVRLVVGEFVAEEEEEGGGNDAAPDDGDDATTPDDDDPLSEPYDRPLNDGVTLPRTRIPGEPGGELLVLLDDNRVARVQWAHVAAVVGGGEAADGVPYAPAPFTQAPAAVTAAADTTTAAAAWKGIPGGALAAPGSAATAAAAAALARGDASAGATLLLPSAEDELALRAARADYRAAKGAARRSKKAAAAKVKQPPACAAAARAAAAAAVEADRAARTAAAMRSALDADASASWRGFEAVLAVLAGAGAVDGEAVAAGAECVPLAPLGEVARGLASDNELWLATLLTHPAVQTLPPPQLAAAVSAVAAGELSVRPGVRAAYPPSPAVVAAVAATEPDRAVLARLQADADLAAPIGVDLRLAGVAEAWASGATWAQAVADTPLDAGDVARFLQRCVDLLRQAGHCAALPPGVRKDARRAARAMYRTPISDTVE